MKCGFEVERKATNANGGGLVKEHKRDDGCQGKKSAFYCDGSREGRAEKMQ